MEMESTFLPDFNVMIYDDNTDYDKDNDLIHIDYEY